MSQAHGSHAKVMRLMHGDVSYPARMTTPEAAATRTLALELTETDWRALRALEPDAVGWLRALIQARLTADRSPAQVEQFDEY